MAIPQDYWNPSQYKNWRIIYSGYSLKYFKKDHFCNSVFAVPDKHRTYQFGNLPIQVDYTLRYFSQQIKYVNFRTDVIKATNRRRTWKLSKP